MLFIYLDLPHAEKLRAPITHTYTPIEELLCRNCKEDVWVSLIR